MSRAIKTQGEQLADAQEIIRQKNVRISALEKTLRERVVEKDSAERVRVEIFGLTEYTAEAPAWLNQEPKGGKSTSGVPVMPVSDWHWGELVDPDQVGGANKFNRAIARKRVRALFNSVCDLCFNHMTNPTYPGIVMPVLGDMITGNIHEELRETNDGPLMWSLSEVEDNLVALILGLAKKFGKVFVPCVPGNHARNTLRPRFKNKVFESYEWLIFNKLEKRFRDDPRIEIHVPNEVDAHFEVYGHRFMITHGDTLGVKGGDGLIGALGPIARGAMKIGRAEATIGRDFDTLIIGHFHIRVPRGDATPVWVNPALIGYNEHARLGLRVPFTRPAQSLQFVHHKWGLTAQWPIYLDEPAKQTKRPWCSWEKAKPYDIDAKVEAFA